MLAAVLCENFPPIPVMESIYVTLDGNANLFLAKKTPSKEAFMEDTIHRGERQEEVVQVEKVADQKWNSYIIIWNFENQFQAREEIEEEEEVNKILSFCLRISFAIIACLLVFFWNRV